MKYLKLFGVLNLLLLLLSCGLVKEGFQNPKKKSSDEFLVEKKSPLVMPPNFNELPTPKDVVDITQIEGIPPERAVILEFESVDAAKNAYNSKDYQAALKKLDGGADRFLFVIEGS